MRVTPLHFSLCHTFPLPFTITIHNFDYHPCLRLTHPLPRLCASPGDANLTPCPTGTSTPDPWGTVTIVRNTVSHCPPLKLVIKCAESNIVHALVMTTAGGYTPNCLTSPTVITPSAWCARSMGHTLPLCLQLSYYDLVHLQDCLLQCRSVEDINRMLCHAEADNEDLRSDNARLQEENDKLKARLASMGPLQPQYSTTDTPLRAPSSFRGRAWEQEHRQCQSMGYPPATHHHDAQGKPPTHKDT